MPFILWAKSIFFRLTFFAVPVRLITILALWFSACSNVLANDNAIEVYAAYQASVYQVKIIEVASGSQSSLGTGFVVFDSKTLATNYHVIASKVFDPEKYRIEIQRDDDTIVFNVAHIDVVNDLAILQPIKDEVFLGEPFMLEAKLPSKGASLYSLGNPHNLGMTVVEGVFNGLVEHRFNQQIHFSGAINSGMSGGPVLNASAKVVGVNVATSGNQIGFLVPSQALERLLLKYNNDMLDEVTLTTGSSLSLIKQVGQQISAHTSAMVEAALSSVWSSNTMGGVIVKTAEVDWLDCWGNSNENEALKITKITRGCHSGNTVYIGPRFNSGFMEYEYLYVSAPQWPSYNLYQYLAGDTSKARPANRGTKKDLSTYRCVNQEVINRNNLTARTSFCLRAYKQFDDLYDAFYLAVSVDKPQEAVMSHFTLAGVNQKTAHQFLAYFTEAVAWP